jgi:hypothetical protein
MSLLGPLLGSVLGGGSGIWIAWCILRQFWKKRKVVKAVAGAVATAAAAEKKDKLEAKEAPLTATPNSSLFKKNHSTSMNYYIGEFSLYRVLAKTVAYSRMRHQYDRRTPAPRYRKSVSSNAKCLSCTARCNRTALETINGIRRAPRSTVPIHIFATLVIVPFDI